LDCTRGFVSNKKEEVTILVGISENNIPIAGVIGQPFKLNKFNKCTFDPRVFIGSDYFNDVDEKKHCF
jgi:3'-phosphoadenosine 5'-phosphosulfate (PAPS) 3'-phosphatase